MAKLNAGRLLSSLAELRREKGAKVVFLYLAEAHAADTWPLSPNAQTVHRSLEQRLAAAASFLAARPELASLVDEWYMDSLDEATTLSNGLWPERYMLLNGQTVMWASSLSMEDRNEDIPALLDSTAASLW